MLEKELRLTYDNPSLCCLHANNSLDALDAYSSLTLTGNQYSKLRVTETDGKTVKESEQKLGLVGQAKN